MLPDGTIVLLAGSDPDLLMLRSAVLAAAGIWSMRVRTVDQAVQVAGFVPFDLAITCYTWDEDDQHRLAGVLAGQNLPVRMLHLTPGDDCSGTCFMRKVAGALAQSPREARAILEPWSARAGMIR
jgi:hypothetical protein